MPKDPMKKITYDAPIGSVDLSAFDEQGEPYVIWPCTECRPWHLEILHDPEKELTLVREWHAVGCSNFRSLIADR
jgi:hypothetical protein